MSIPGPHPLPPSPVDFGQTGAPGERVTGHDGRSGGSDHLPCSRKDKVPLFRVPRRCGVAPLSSRLCAPRSPALFTVRNKYLFLYFNGVYQMYRFFTAVFILLRQFSFGLVCSLVFLFLLIHVEGLRPGRVGRRRPPRSRRTSASCFRWNVFSTHSSGRPGPHVGDSTVVGGVLPNSRRPFRERGSTTRRSVRTESKPVDRVDSLPGPTPVRVLRVTHGETPSLRGYRVRVHSSHDIPDTHGPSSSDPLDPPLGHCQVSKGPGPRLRLGTTPLRLTTREDVRRKPLSRPTR